MASKKKDIITIPPERIVNRIFLIRGKKVMFDSDLAELYGVETRVLNQAVMRNIKRFPEDFMFQLNEKEFEILKSQFVTSSWGGKRKRPLVFTEQGVAMLSSVLNSERAVQVNIRIIRAFTKLRELITTNKDLRRKIEDMERKYGNQFKKHDQEINTIYTFIKKLLEPPKEPKRPIGFRMKMKKK